MKAYSRIIREAEKRDEWNRMIDVIQEDCHMIGAAVVTVAGLYFLSVLSLIILGEGEGILPWLIGSGALTAFGFLLLAM